MTNASARLRAYGDARRKVILMSKQLEAVREIPDTPPSVLTARTNSLKLAKAERDRALRDLEGLLALVPNKENMREILTLRYRDLLIWDKVADSLMLDRRWVLRLHKRALNYLEGLDMYSALNNKEKEKTENEI